MKTLLIVTVIIFSCATSEVSGQGEQSKKVTIFPSKTWCKKYGYVRHDTVYGEPVQVPDYYLALSESENDFPGASLSKIMTIIQDGFRDQNFTGFTFTTLQDEFDQIEDEEGLINSSTALTGGAQTSLDNLDIILGAIKPDVKLDLSYNKVRIGPRFAYEVILRVVNPYTAEEVAGQTATSEARSLSDPEELIREAVGSIVFQVADDIRDYLADVEENGQKIRLRVLVSDQAGFDLKDKCSGFNTEYSNLIKSWATKVAKNGSVSSSRGGGIQSLEFPFIRMPDEVTVLRGGEEIDMDDLFGGGTDSGSSGEKPTKFPADPILFAECLADFLNARCEGCNATHLETGLTSIVFLGSNR